MEFMQRVSLAARSASLRLPPPRAAAGLCIAGLPPGRTPVTCATDVARSDMSWGLTPKTGPKRSAVERDLTHLCVPFCADFHALSGKCVAQPLALSLESLVGEAWVLVSAYS